MDLDVQIDGVLAYSMWRKDLERLRNVKVEGVEVDKIDRREDYRVEVGDCQWLGKKGKS